MIAKRRPQGAVWPECRFLLDTYGRELLSSGSGVLDVAGGKGELAFELVNLNNIPATVVEPRALKLAKQELWLKVGPCTHSLNMPVPFPQIGWLPMNLHPCVPVQPERALAAALFLIG